MEYVENAMNLALEKIGANLVMPKDLRKILKIGLVEIKISMNSYNNHNLMLYILQNFQNVTYIAKGGFGKIYSAEWPEGPIGYWDIENQKWFRRKIFPKVALKSLNNSSNISMDFLNEVIKFILLYIKRLLFI